MDIRDILEVGLTQLDNILAKQEHEKVNVFAYTIRDTEQVIWKIKLNLMGTLNIEVPASHSDEAI